MRRNVVNLDVREDIRRGREPFSRIMQAVASLKPGDDLCLLAPFEPAPLFKVLAQQGFSHRSTPLENGDFEVVFSREPSAESGKGGAGPQRAAQDSTPSSGRACAGPPTLEVDARGLEPPQPLVTILEAVASLPAGAQLRALTDRRPMHLYPQLEERGLVGITEERPDGSFITYIRRR